MIIGSLKVLYCYSTFINWDMVPVWIQAVTSGLAAIFLIKTVTLQRLTLKSQKSVIVEQQKINKIQYESYLRGFKPEISLTSQSSPNNGGRKVNFEIEVSQNEARNVDFLVFRSEDFRVQLPSKESRSLIRPKGSIGFYFDASSETLLQAYQSKETIGQLMFEDAIGTKYSVCVYMKGETAVGLQTPSRLEVG